MAEFVVIQLEYDKCTKVAVNLAWVMDGKTISEKLHKSIVHQETVFFFYHADSTTEAVFNTSDYSQTFNPEVPSCYKGYVGRKIYGKLSQAELTK